MSRWTSAVVVLAVRDKSGQTVSTLKMSRWLKRRAEAEGELRRVQELYPAAYLEQITR